MKVASLHLYQAFSRTSVQESCGWSLVEENRLIFLLLPSKLFVWAGPVAHFGCPLFKFFPASRGSFPGVCSSCCSLTTTWACCILCISLHQFRCHWLSPHCKHGCLSACSKDFDCEELRSLFFFWLGLPRRWKDTKKLSDNQFKALFHFFKPAIARMHACWPGI